MLLWTGQMFGNTGGGSSYPDPPFANVVGLWGFEGTDGSTTLTDESASAHGSGTANGNAQIDTAQFKFGSSSGLFDGSGDYWSWADNADWRLSAANSDLFTIEFWVRWAASQSNARLMGHAGASGNIGWYINSTASASNAWVQFGFTTTGASPTLVGTAVANLALNTWHHIAISKNASGKIRIWRNGTLDDSATPANSAFFDSTNAFEIGRAVASAVFNGWIDEAPNQGLLPIRHGWLDHGAYRGIPAIVSETAICATMGAPSCWRWLGFF